MRRTRSRGRVRDDPIRGPARPRPEPARLQGEGPLADVDQRAEQHRPDERHERAQPADERSLDPEAARLLGLEDRSGPRLHPRHHLDRRQDDERDPMAGAAGDHRLEEVVGEGREEERAPRRGRRPGVCRRRSARTSGLHAVTASGPNVTSRSVAPGKKRALTTRIEVSSRAGMRMARMRTGRRPARPRSDEQRDGQERAARAAAAGTPRAGRRRARGAWSAGWRRCSQLLPAMK